ncbi:hypothetical protein P9112_006768 [Eukaryota sp. TZLM1-RC]
MLPPPAYNTNQYPGQGYPGQGMPGQGYPNQGMPGQGMPGQGFPNQGMPGMQGQGMPQQFVQHLSGFAQTMFQNNFCPNQQRMMQTQQKFRAIDTDGSGEIGFSELVNAFQGAIDHASIRMLINLFDSSGSYEINVYEFTMMDTFIESIRAAWTQNSVNGQLSSMQFPNFISQALYGIANQLQPATFNFVLACFDKNRSGSIGYNDAVKLCILIAITRQMFLKTSQGTPTAQFNLDALIRLVASTH